MFGKRYILHIIASICVLILATVAMGMAVFFAKIAAKPMDLLPYLPHAQGYLEKHGYRLTLESAWLSFDGSLNIDAKGIRFEPMQYPNEALTAREAELDLAPEQLLLARLAFNKIILNQPELPITLSRSAIRILGQSIAFKKGEQPTEVIDIIEFLNGGGDWGYLYSSLNRAQMIDGLVRIESTLLPGEKLLQDMQLNFNSSWHAGETLNLKALLTTPESSVPFYLAADHASGAEVMSLRLRIEDANSALVEPFLPAAVQNRAALELTLDFKTELGRENKIISPQLGITAETLEINLPEAYSWPLKYSDISGLFGYSDTAGGTVYIKYLQATDSFGTVAVVKGDISHLNDTPKFNVTANVASGAKDSVLQYIPHGKAHDWIKENVLTAKVKDAVIGFYGSLKGHKLDGEDGRAYLKISGDIYDAEVVTYGPLPNAKNIAGRYEWQKNDMRIMVHQASLGSQEAKDVAVEITRIFKDEPTLIRIIGTATGPTQQALDYASDVLEFDIPIKVAGQHISALSLVFPAIKGLKLSDTTFKSSSDFLNMETDLPLGFGRLVTNNAVLDITEKSLEFNTSGFLNEQPITMLWWENLQALFKQTRVQLNGQLDAGILQDHLPIKGEINGILGTVLTLEQSKPDAYKYTLAGDLTDTNISLPDLGWSKPSGQEAKLAALGSVKQAGQVVVADALSMKGTALDVQGRAEFNTKALAQSKLDFTSFRLGQTDATIKYQSNLLQLKGESLYLGEFITQDKKYKKEDNKTAFLNNGSIDIDIDRLIMPATEVKNLKANLKRSNGWWTSGTVKATLADKNSFTASIKPTKAGTEVSAKSDNAGELMKVLRLNNSLRGGSLESTIVFNRNKKSSKANGVGHVHIKDIRVLNAPVLLNILQILSLEDLISPGEGMLFDTMLIPLTYDGNIHVQNVKIKGPTLGFKLKGDINLDQRSVHIKGTVIPLRGINQAIAKIPLIGPILTGSQEALIAADFTVKGPFEEPKVSMNPFSFITPGLIKDIFR